MIKLSFFITCLSSLQCSSLAPTDGQKCSLNEIFWDEKDTRLCSLHERICKLITCCSYQIVSKLCNLIKFMILQKGITLLLINLDNSTTVEVKVAFNGTATLHHQQKHHRSNKYQRSHRTRNIKLPQGSESSTREEYHLTAKDGNLHSQTMLLNGNILTVNSSGNIPALEPVSVNLSKPISVAPFSVVFVHLPYVVPACS